MWQNGQCLYKMSYLEVFEVLTGVGVDVSKFFGVGAGVLKRGAGAESESEKCDSAHHWSKPDSAHAHLCSLLCRAGSQICWEAYCAVAKKKFIYVTTACHRFWRRGDAQSQCSVIIVGIALLLFRWISNNWIVSRYSLFKIKSGNLYNLDFGVSCKIVWKVALSVLFWLINGNK